MKANAMIFRKKKEEKPKPPPEEKEKEPQGYTLKEIIEGMRRVKNFLDKKLKNVPGKKEIMLMWGLPPISAPKQSIFGEAKMYGKIKVLVCLAVVLLVSSVMPVNAMAQESEDNSGDTSQQTVVNGSQRGIPNL